MLIVKKMPILQGFPDFETVKNLSGNAAEDVNFSPLFYDIELVQFAMNLVPGSYISGLHPISGKKKHYWRFFQNL